MGLVLLLGGTRSGKSRLAVRLAGAAGGPVVVIATGEPRDDEMLARIRRHRAERPADWATVEEPIDLARALTSAPDEATVLLDCLTLWVSNLMELGLTDPEIEGRARTAAALAAGRRAPTVVVSNEVGSGIVPVSQVARRYADLLGQVNAIWAEAAERTVLCVAGRIVRLDDPSTVVDLLFGRSEGPADGGRDDG